MIVLHSVISYTNGVVEFKANKDFAEVLQHLNEAQQPIVSIYCVAQAINQEVEAEVSNES